MSKDRDELLNSNYDGIQEYDNDLPRWWLTLFYLTIVFAVVYVGYYQFASGWSSEASLASAMASIQARQQASKPPEAVGDAGLLAIAKDPVHLAQGKSVFDSRCMPCHGLQAQGIVGPNLTDDYWIHGGKLSDVQRTVREGILDKGMLAWKGVLTDTELNDVVVYIHSLRGSNPPNPKAPQGELSSEHE